MKLSKRFWTTGLVLVVVAGGIAFAVLMRLNPGAGQPVSWVPAAPSSEGVLGTPLQTSAPTRWVNDLTQLPEGAVSHVDLVYFHRTERCTACINAENYTRETLQTHFADQLKAGRMSLRVLDMEKTENAAFVKRFDASGSALYLSVLVQGTEYLCANQDIWLLTSNKYLFVNTLKNKLSLLAGRL